MGEFQRLGMQIQPFGFLSVELVADNGAVQSERVGGVYPKLMCASGTWIKSDAGAVIPAFQYLKVCTICRGRSSGFGHSGSSTVPVSCETIP